MFYISNLSVAVQDRTVLQNCSIIFKPGHVYVIMGPNGSGKSSLAATIMGHQGYQILSGSMVFADTDIVAMPSHQRATMGIFLGLQNPIEIQGLSVIHFLKELCSLRDGKSISVADMMQQVEPLLQLVGLPQSIMQRYVNVGFSGGEKKRFELLQMLLLRPKIAILDELDSGVDIDGLKDLANGLLWYRQQYPDTILVLVTHYRHILNYVHPDVIHIMIDGSLVAVGDSSLLDAIEKDGYEQYAKRS